MRTRQRGLTLLELLVALLIFALLSVVAYRGLNGILAARSRVVAEKQHWRDLSMFFRRFEQDMQLAINRPVRNADGSMDPALLCQTSADTSRLAFTRTAIAGYGGANSGLQRLGYLLQDHQVKLLIWPVVDAAPDTTPQATVLLKDVAALDFSFLDKQGQWQQQWPQGAAASAGPAVALQMLPVAVKVTVQMTSGEKIDRFFLVGR